MSPANGMFIVLISAARLPRISKGSSVASRTMAAGEERFDIGEQLVVSAMRESSVCPTGPS
jgi:hypothetical protein